MWYRTVIVLAIIAISLISSGNILTPAYSKNVVALCPSGYVYNKVLENDTWWIYVYCDGAIVDKYITVE
jgi:hypothetical protein